MQKAIQYRTWLPPATVSTQPESRIRKLVTENALIVFAKRGCCMCHVAKQLLLGLGVNPIIEEVEEKDEEKVVEELSIIAGVFDDNGRKKLLFPSIFVGGNYFGDLERIMGTHITGELVPILRQAGALWL